MPAGLSLVFRLDESAAAQALWAAAMQVTGHWSQGVRAWPWHNSLPRHGQQPLKRGRGSDPHSKGEVVSPPGSPRCGGRADGKSLTSGASAVPCRA